MLLLSAPVFAGQKYEYEDNHLSDEMANNYKEHSFPNWVNARGSSATITYIKVSTISAVRTSYPDGTSQVTAYPTYKKPGLIFQGVTTVDVSTNTETANQTCINFPDQRRCVTENTASTSVNRRAIITETASNSGTKNSGLRTGYVEVANEWYAIYAWKVSDNSTDFVLAIDTLTPVQSNYSALNSFYGTNAWVYLGTIKNGNGTQGNGDILGFKMRGPVTYFTANNSDVSGGSSLFGNSIAMTTAGGNTSLTWAYSEGTSSGTIPGHIGLVNWTTTVDTSASLTLMTAKDSGNSGVFSLHQNNAGNAGVMNWWSDPTLGVRLSTPVGSRMSIHITAFVDDALSGPSAGYLIW